MCQAKHVVKLKKGTLKLAKATIGKIVDELEPSASDNSTTDEDGDSDDNSSDNSQTDEESFDDGEELDDNEDDEDEDEVMLLTRPMPFLSSFRRFPVTQ